MDVPAVPHQDILRVSTVETSTAICQRVTQARHVQSERFSRTRIFCNAQMASRQIKKYCRIDAACISLLETAIDKLGISARAYNRILKIARTIADLAGDAEIAEEHVSEAIQYRNLDRAGRFR